MPTTALTPSNLAKLHSTTYHLSGVAMQKRIASFTRETPRWSNKEASKLARQAARRLQRNA
jgi:hypothetical protein